MKSLSALIIEDNEADFALEVATLARSGYDVNAARVDKERDLNEALSKPWDVVLCDHGLPDLDVPDVISRLRSLGSDTPVIVVTGTMDDEEAVRVVKQGAHDYLLKDRMARLGASVERALAEAGLARTHRDAAEQMSRLTSMTSALRMIGTAISASTDVKVTLSVLLDHTVQILGVDAVCVLLLNDRTRVLEFSQGRGFKTDMFSKARIRLGQGVEGTCVSRMETLVVNDLKQDQPRFLHAEMASKEGFTSVVATPLIAKGQPLGVLEVFDHSPFEASREREDALESMATAAAIAVDNARLLDSAQKKSMELEQTYQDTLEGWAAALELRDYETEGHSRRVTGLSDLIGREMGLDEKALEDLRRGALLHDVGKMAVPDQILLKPGKLTEEEWDVIRLHPEHGYKMVSGISYLKPAAEIVYSHHEKWDGTGYPRRLRGAEIPVGARIFAITDVFDALRSRRPYKEPWPLENVISEIKAGGGSHFDPECVHAFLRIDRELLW